MYRAETVWCCNVPGKSEVFVVLCTLALLQPWAVRYHNTDYCVHYEGTANHQPLLRRLLDIDVVLVRLPS